MSSAAAAGSLANMRFPGPAAATTGVNPQSRQPHFSLPAITEQVSTTNLYIRGLPKVYTDEDLVKLCTKFGNITSTKAILDKNTNLCIGYGFVDFENPADAQNAVIALQYERFQAQFAKPQNKDPTCLYFSNLPPWANEEFLESLVKPYGKITSLKVIRHLWNSKVVGYCRMENREDCKKVIEHNMENVTLAFRSDQWKDYQEPYMHEAPPHIVPPTGVMGRGGLVHQSMMAPQYLSGAQVHGYQVPASGVSSIWQYYMQPASAIPGGGQVDSVLGTGATADFRHGLPTSHRHNITCPPHSTPQGGRPHHAPHGQDHSSDGHALGGEMKPHHIQVTSGNDQQQQQHSSRTQTTPPHLLHELVGHANL